MDTKQLKAANPIEKVAARYGTLHRSGVNYKMLCPFHDDHHPSLGIHVAGQYFKCHACGAAGDVIGLVMGFEHCLFAEAVKILAPQETVGKPMTLQGTGKPLTHPLPLERGKVTPVDDRKRSVIIKENNDFLRLLLPVASGHSELSPTWLDFGVGLAPAFVPEPFRAMRGRIIFPVYDADGVLTGFGARRVDTGVQSGMQAGEVSDSPKYLNSANNGLFDKSRMLYGIHRAAEAIRQKGFAYLTEGYKDTLAMHAAGFTNTVALGGTAFTPGQAAVLHGFCNRAVLLLDNDPAGQAATFRLLEEPPGGLQLSSLRLPLAKDPDELFRRLGRSGFCRYMQLLTERVGAGEKRLLAFCLKHPETARHVERMLEEDDLPFTSEVYCNLLHFTAMELSPLMIPEAERLLTEILSTVLPDVPLPAGVPAALLSETEETVCHDLADYFRLEYYEERILAETARLAELLKATPGSHADLLEPLSRHLSVQAALTASLSRTPVVDERWLLCR
ncbi:CHC2 zinc finger domain-containing protein [uncultured Parabacteroides sp.]|uniref:CHC2 zinc finger domain-containing protein n=1 Tax=uncultured Parabacteroides sp. TaxID=512312 RepID=UPI0025EAB872|nr:CHC2 zinc finger domain-containing protein [uncultured Parabacteroides sp.]